MNGTRRGALIGGTWLIGVGVVFLVRQALDLDWGEAWPLFVILVGVATFITTIIERRPGVTGPWDFTWPIVWTAVGVLLLLSTTGRLGTGPGELISQGWPWLLVALGAWFIIGALVPGRRSEERLVIPLEGAADASVKIRFGAGTLTSTIAAPGTLVDGEFRGGVIHRRVGPGSVELEQDTSFGLPWLNRESGWTVGLTGEVPLDLQLEAGASRTRLDLRDTRLRRLVIKTGASDTQVVLPRAAGATDVRVESGAASVTLTVPTGVAARIRSSVALGSVQVDQARFPRSGDVYESTDYATSANRVDIDLQGGVGTVRIRGES